MHQSFHTDAAPGCTRRKEGKQDYKDCPSSHDPDPKHASLIHRTSRGRRANGLILQGVQGRLASIRAFSKAWSVS